MARETITCPSAFYNTTFFEQKIIQFMQNLSIPILCPTQTETASKLPGDEIEFYLDYHGMSSLRKTCRRPLCASPPAPPLDPLLGTRKSSIASVSICFLVLSLGGGREEGLGRLCSLCISSGSTQFMRVYYVIHSD